jgi:putative DNA primase/helicase
MERFHRRRPFVPPGNKVGLGFVLTADDPYVVLDLDKVRNPETGDVVGWAQRILNMFPDTRVYVSVSSKGSHIWLRWSKPLNGGINLEVTKEPHTSMEMYDRERYLAMSGEIYGKNDIKDHTEQILKLYDWMRKQQTRQEEHRERAKSSRSRRDFRRAPESRGSTAAAPPPTVPRM